MVEFVLQQVALMVEDFDEFFITLISITASSRSNILWACPSVSQITLNTDGSFNCHKHQIGYGSLIRNTYANWLSGFSSSFAGSCGISTEILVIKHDLILAWELSYQYVVCERNSLNAIRMLDSPPSLSHFSALLMKIDYVSTRLWRVSFQHVRCEANMCVDKLALLGLRFQFVL